jgi:hypothetical protein
MWVSAEAQVTLKGSVSESPNHKLIILFNTSESEGLPEYQNHKRSRWGLRVMNTVFYTC